MRRLIIDCDPGIGDALAIVLALADPNFDLLAITPCAGCVAGSVATRNIQAIVATLDPAKWPKLGSARGAAGVADPAPDLFEPLLGPLHGPTGLGDLEFPSAQLHSPHDSSKILVDLVRAMPHEVTVLCLGPLTNIAAAAERAPDFLESIGSLVCLGGAISCGGDVTASAETNLFLNPEAARLVIGSRHAKKLVPIDVTSKVILAIDQFPRITETDSVANRFLRKLLPVSFRTHHQLLGIEGIRIAEAAALALISRPHLAKTQTMPVHVETDGLFSRGSTIADRRPQFSSGSNTEVVTELDAQGVIDYVAEILKSHP